MNVAPLDPSELALPPAPVATDGKTMMRFGDYRFALETAAYQTFERANSWRWPEQERIGARPALQYVGPGAETINLRGTIYPHFKGGLGQVDAMRAEADKGAPLRLVGGNGRVFGRYVLTDLRETQRVFFGNGAPRAIEFDLTLSLYGDDGQEQALAVGAGG